MLRASTNRCDTPAAFLRVGGRRGSRDQNGIPAVVPRVSAADASHIGAISLSSIGLVICRSASAIPFPESIHAAKTSSRRASKPGVVTRSEPEAVLDPIPRYKFFSLAPDAGSDPSDYSQHLEGLATGGSAHVKGRCQSPTGAFPEASRVRIGGREGSASAPRMLTEDLNNQEYKSPIF